MVGETEKTELSESVEMYLITIALLQQESLPVPLSHLATVLAHSPVSINEMCRKLVDYGWADYQPYRGVVLTEDGRVLANQVLCRRRLWEVFLVDKLGIDPKQAEAFACDLEHVTPEKLAGRLALFLDYPTFSPQNQPIPCSYGVSHDERTCVLGELPVGRRGRVMEILEAGPVKEFLGNHGLVPGAGLEIVAQASDGSVLIGIADDYVSVAATTAARINVLPLYDGADDPASAESSARHTE